MRLSTELKRGVKDSRGQGLQSETSGLPFNGTEYLIRSNFLDPLNPLNPPPNFSSFIVIMMLENSTVHPMGACNSHVSLAGIMESLF